jgi:ketosteroid isomerase-like protein
MSGSLLEELFRAVDTRDASGFVEFLAPDAVFRFGNAPIITGRAAISTAVSEFFRSIAGLDHRLLGRWADGDSMACHGEVTYSRHDGSTVTLPFANVFRLRDGLISEYLIYADLSPLYDPGAGQA